MGHGGGGGGGGTSLLCRDACFGLHLVERDLFKPPPVHVRPDKSSRCTSDLTNQAGARQT